MFSDDFAPLFDNTDLDALALAQCNTLGRWPILPLSATLDPAIADGTLSDDCSSPITPLDAFNLGLFTQQQHDAFGSHFNQCLPMSALYMPPQVPSEVDTASISDSSSPEPDSVRSLMLPGIAPIVPSQADSASKKRAAPSEGAPATKKPRVVNTRVRAKDFVPPDVSGLSKREARLVKNRAAAFLSRQRKREEFEAMEIRLTDLERENADLRRASLADAADCVTDPSEESLTPSERQLASLRRLLQSAEDRECALKRELEDLREGTASSPSSIDSPADGSDDQRASVGLMTMLSLSSVLHDSTGSWARELASADSSLAFCDASSGVPEIEVSSSTLVDGKLRVNIRRRPLENGPSLTLPSANSVPQKRIRVSLARAQLGEDNAELDIEIR
ncbi:hypothetical protein BKA62DRAFT_816581 [Auriculariales sp. MPI-PUGE-AT-0066]|nr:hypothetical protein BKA62DRAFT_816581 [Auriculariales sp. MPI-PUGE-AT-0066]